MNRALAGGVLLIVSSACGVGFVSTETETTATDHGGGGAMAPAGAGGGTSDTGGGATSTGGTANTGGGTSSTGGAGGTLAYADLIKSHSPIAYYRLESGPPWIDEMGAYPTTVLEPVTVAAGLITEGGNGAMFNGSATEGHLDLGSGGPDFVGTASFTLEAWMQPTDTFGLLFRTLMNGGNTGWELRYDNGSAVMVRAFDMSNKTTVTTPLAQGSPMHVVGTYDGATLCVYVNAVPTCVADPVMAAAGTSVKMGRNVSGVLDELAIYDTALDASVVTEHFQAGTR